MASFLNTEQTYSASGVSRTWLAANALEGESFVRNSGGIVNVSGSVILNAVIPIALSGSIASNSGVVLQVSHAISGMTAALSGNAIYFQDLTGTSGLGTGGFTIVPPSLQSNILCRSGLVTVNSGTHTFDLVVVYTRPQV